MRVSTDPTDPAYINDRPRRVWSNDREITDWAVADEFRRCVITRDGKVHNGSVRIERLEQSEAEPEALRAADAVADAGFVGMFVHVPDAPKPAPVAGPVLRPESAAPPVVDKPSKAAAKVGKRRR